ncbi:hypothetical protein IHE55_00400 [Streptomyces pactum]|uniref:Uncharacterized protein n=1 Tax=Streptomyces pactum TaxID=68249 RepID=A0ABS0NDV9_9ACTN|nr:hypothetical protein [Streptomyces pactum]MBH5333341.1 hypothetical protein [Streptomyces pactum]
MALPGFTGGMSVYRTGRSYRGGPRRTGAGGGAALVPQLRSFCQMECGVECRNYCKTQYNPARCMADCMGPCVCQCETPDAKYCYDR